MDPASDKGPSTVDSGLVTLEGSPTDEFASYTLGLSRLSAGSWATN